MGNNGKWDPATVETHAYGYSLYSDGRYWFVRAVCSMRARNHHVPVSRTTLLGLRSIRKVRYSSTGRHGDELNTGCGAAW